MDTIDKLDIEIVYDAKIPRTKPSGHLEIEPKETKPEVEEIDVVEFVVTPIYWCKLNRANGSTFRYNVKRPNQHNTKEEEPWLNSILH